MDGYSEIGTIFFSIGEKTAFAKEQGSQIVTGSYKGSPPYANINGPLSKELKKYHAAEHKVYNAFMKKIRKLDEDASLEDLKNYIPSLEDARKADAFSIFCGTTFLLSSGILLIGSALPNLSHFHNLEYKFMLPWLMFCLAASLGISYFVQKKYFLDDVDDHHLQLAIEALKEVLRND